MKYTFYPVVAILGMYGAFNLGESYSRHRITALTNELTKSNVNSFTVCLTRLWEESGELSPEWRDHRRWVLQSK